MSAGDTTTHWDKFRSVATDVSDEYDNVCVCSHQIHCGCIGFSSLSQVGRWLILCAHDVCSWPKQKTTFQKCTAELSNHGMLPASAQKFMAELQVLDAGPPNLTDCLTAIFALNCAM